MKPVFALLRKHALAFPKTREDLPWGESGKTFLIMRVDADGLHLSVKLPQSAPYALDQKFTAPTGYGLGASGWVTADFGPKAKPPVELLKGWIEETIAPWRPRNCSPAPRKGR